jgi:hypothetical protein
VGGVIGEESRKAAGTTACRVSGVAVERETESVYVPRHPKPLMANFF